jgi:hypothetical protein
VFGGAQVLSDYLDSREFGWIKGFVHHGSCSWGRIPAVAGELGACKEKFEVGERVALCTRYARRAQFYATSLRVENTVLIFIVPHQVGTLKSGTTSAAFSVLREAIYIL